MTSRIRGRLNLGSGPKIGHPPGGDDGPETSHTGPAPLPPALPFAQAPPDRVPNPAPLGPGSQVTGRFLVSDVQARGGEFPHTILLLTRAGERIATAPFWEAERHRIEGVARGDVVEVAGSVGLYRGRPQLQVDSLRPLLPEAIAWDELLPSVGPVTAYWESLDQWRAALTAPRLAAVLGLFYDDPNFRARYQRCPASLAGHHAALGGLLLHTVEVAVLTQELARLYPTADPELLLAGALLHDIGKLEAYRWERGFGSTEAGSAIGHVVLGALLLERRIRAAPAPPCTEAELLLLQHLVLSHHGRLEFGAPVVPMTLEAELLHHADLASARGAAMDAALREPANFPDGAPVSARPLWQLDHRKVWRGKSDWGRAADLRMRLGRRGHRGAPVAASPVPPGSGLR